MEKVILQPRREYATDHRHPWIFSGAIKEVAGPPAAGETVEVCDVKGRCLGYGSWSPASQIRVRMLSFAEEEVPDAAFVRRRVAEAVARRASFLAGGETNACRLVNAESDGLPGVVADLYDGTAVVQLATAGAEFWKHEIAGALMDSVPGCTGVWNRSDVDSRAREGLSPETGLLAGAEPPELTEIHEGAIRYLVDVRKGHKTGFYLDQREARATVGAYANGAEVLNCFSYTGGFGLAAQAAGARAVTHVDASADALALARRNAALTPNPAGTAVDFLVADVFKQLRRYRDEGRSFDLIVLDPPKFAETKAGLMRATRGYKDINLLAMKLLRPGGMLATFSCSGAVTPELFAKVCAEAEFDAKRNFQIAARTRQATDHPVLLSFPEGLYLKGLILRAMD
ncbi:MAG: class I SAM-dependent methyltransferase [Kiritimatiellae bacterium]|nr:class I SAM-dependent methyltransferase [Kiritimatiellia bacterium]